MKISTAKKQTPRLKRYKEILAGIRLDDPYIEKDNPPRYLLVSYHGGWNEKSAWIEHYEEMPTEVEDDLDEHGYIPIRLYDLDSDQEWTPKTTITFEPA